MAVHPCAEGGNAELAWLIMALKAAALAGVSAKDTKGMRWQALELTYGKVVGGLQSHGGGVQENAISTLEHLLAIVKSEANLPGVLDICAGKHARPPHHSPHCPRPGTPKHILAQHSSSRKSARW